MLKRMTRQVHVRYEVFLVLNSFAGISQQGRVADNSTESLISRVSLRLLCLAERLVLKRYPRLSSVESAIDCARFAIFCLNDNWQLTHLSGKCEIEDFAGMLYVFHADFEIYFECQRLLRDSGGSTIESILRRFAKRLPSR